MQLEMIGLGWMETNMVRRLLQAGYQCFVPYTSVAVT